MAKRKRTSVYTKERNRIKNYINKQYKKGLYIDIYIPTEVELKKQGVKGSELTKLTNRLKKIKPKDLIEIGMRTPQPFSQAQLSSQIETSKEKNAYKLKEHIKPPSIKNEPDFTYTDVYEEDSEWIDNVTISMWEGQLNTFERGKGYNLLKAWENTIISQQGRHVFAEMLREGSASGYIINWEVVYKTEIAREYISGMINHLPEAGVLYQDEIMDRVDVAISMNDYYEGEEDWELPI